jgi:hypothetical protein
MTLVLILALGSIGCERLGKQRPTSSKISVSSTVQMGDYHEPSHLTPEKVEAERRRQIYGKERTSPNLSLDNPSRSTALTDFLLVPLVQLFEANRPGDLSDSAVAGLVREIARSFLPTSIGQALTADNVRKRVDAELRRRSEPPWARSRPTSALPSAVPSRFSPWQTLHFSS